MNVWNGVLNVEFLVTAAQQAGVNVSLSFVHTARRYLRWHMGRTPRGVSLLW